MARGAPIAITGATGRVGGAVANALVRRNTQMRLIVRDLDRAPRLPATEVVRASYEDGEGMRNALAGADTLFLVSATENPRRVDQHLSAVDAAVAAGVRRIVYLSLMGAGPDATFTFARDHFHTEQHIRASGLDFTFLRPSLYADNVPVFCSVEGVIRGPAGQGRVAWVTRTDVADSAAAALTGAGYDGATFELTGPEALTMAETASTLGGVIGRDISYAEETLEGARATRAGAGAPWEIEGWITSYAAIANGEMASVTDDVAKLAGRRAQPLSSFLRTNAETYQHLLVARYRQH